MVDTRKKLALSKEVLNQSKTRMTATLPGWRSFFFFFLVEYCGQWQPQNRKNKTAYHHKTRKDARRAPGIQKTKVSETEADAQEANKSA